MRHRTKIALGAALTTALVGCNSTEAPPPQLAASPQPAQAASPDQKPMHEQLEQSELDAVAPFVLTLDAPEKNLTGPGELTITAHLNAPRKIGAATHIQVSLPSGVKLTKGSPEETLAYLPAGLTLRTFKVHVTTPPTETRPIKISVKMVDSGGAFGAFAERTFPKVAEMKVKPSAVPAPPVARPGAGMSPAKGARNLPGTRKPQLPAN